MSISSYSSNTGGKSKLEALADAGDKAAKKLLKVLRQGREDILAIDDAELKKQAKRFDKLIVDPYSASLAHSLHAERVRSRHFARTYTRRQGLLLE